MSNEPGSTALPAPGVHVGRRACNDLLRQALLTLAPPATADMPSLSGARQVWLIDHQLGDWPLDNDAVLAALTAWLRQGGRSLRLLGTDFDSTARALPRFARWRRDWQHAIDIHQPTDGHLATAWRGLLAPPWCLQWLDAPDGRLRVFTDLTQCRATESLIADFLQRCEPAWPSTILGL